MAQQLKLARGIVAKFFKRDGEKPSDILREVNELTALDTQQLASAIVRQQIPPNATDEEIDVIKHELAFELVDY